MTLKSCPHCHSHSIVSFAGSTINDTFLRCADCLLVYQYPLPNQAEVEEYYSSYLTDIHQESDELNKQRLVAYDLDIDYISKSLPLIGHSWNDVHSCFDYGASGGYLLDLLAAKGITVNGWDYGAESQAQLIDKGYFANPFTSSNQDSDLLILRGVIEHMLDPYKTTQGLIESINPKYILISATPNGSSIAYSLFRDKWRMHIPIEHIWQFSPRHIIDIMAWNGYSVINYECQYLEGPYENIKRDSMIISDRSREMIHAEHIPSSFASPPFFDSMMSLVAVQTRFLNSK